MARGYDPCMSRRQVLLDMALGRPLQCSAYASEMNTTLSPLYRGRPFALAGLIPKNRLDSSSRATHFIGYTLPIGRLADGEEGLKRTLGLLAMRPSLAFTAS